MSSIPAPISHLTHTSNSNTSSSNTQTSEHSSILTWRPHVFSPLPSPNSNTHQIQTLHHQTLKHFMSWSNMDAFEVKQLHGPKAFSVEARVCYLLTPRDAGIWRLFTRDRGVKTTPLCKSPFLHLWIKKLATFRFNFVFPLPRQIGPREDQRESGWEEDSHVKITYSTSC